MSDTDKTIRIHVDVKQHDTTLIFSYKELLKRERAIRSDVHSAMTLDPASIDDKYFQSLLERASKYDMQGEDVQESDNDESKIHGRSGVPDDYDYNDPFIDDSDMLLDEPYENQTQQVDGFFAYEGPLDGGSAKRKAASKPKAKTTKKEKAARAPTSKQDTSEALESENAPDSTSKSAGTKTTATKAKKPATTKDPSTKAPLKKQASDQGDKKKTSKPKKDPGSASSSSKKAVMPADLQPLHPELEAKMTKIRHDASLEDFAADKSKFPPNLRPTVLEAGTIMFRLESKMDENLIRHLMAVIPYNSFTLRKLLTTKVGGKRVKELEEEVEALNKGLKDMIDKVMPELQRQQDERVAAAQSQLQEKQREQQATAEEGSTDTGPTPSVEAEDDPSLAPKFKYNDDMRKTMYDIVQKDGARVALSNSIAEFKSEPTASEDKAQKQLYQKMAANWPEGWMTTAKLRRQYTLYKTKIEKAKLALSTPLPATKQTSTKKLEKNVSGAEDEQKTKRKRPAQLSSSHTSESVLKKQMTVSPSSVEQSSRPQLPVPVEPGNTLPSSHSTLTPISQDRPLNPSESSTTTSPSMSSWAKSPSMTIESLISQPPPPV